MTKLRSAPAMAIKNGSRTGTPPAMAARSMNALEERQDAGGEGIVRRLARQDRFMFIMFRAGLSGCRVRAKRDMAALEREKTRRVLAETNHGTQKTTKNDL